MSKSIINIIGVRYGRLIVIAFAGKTKGNKRLRWKCKCDCGQIVIVDSHNLRGHNTKSCGCLKLEILKNKGDKTDKTLIRRLLNVYKYNAERKNLKFQLSFKKFKQLIFSTCHYCGGSPDRIWKRRDHKYGIYILHNGIDRKDNLEGYTLNNSVSCCNICNRAKSTMPYNEFIVYLKKIKEFI